MVNARAIGLLRMRDDEGIDDENRRRGHGQVMKTALGMYRELRRQPNAAR